MEESSCRLTTDASVPVQAKQSLRFYTEFVLFSAGIHPCSIWLCRGACRLDPPKPQGIYGHQTIEQLSCRPPHVDVCDEGISKSLSCLLKT
jgi:hypothetical protein